MATLTKTRARKRESIASWIETAIGLGEAPATTRPFATEGLVNRARPFVLVGVFTTIVVAVLPPAADPLYLAIGAALGAMTIVLAFAIGRLGLPSWTDVLPPVIGVAFIAVLRQAGGGHEAGLVPVFGLAIVWVALYGTRRQMLVVLLATVVATVIPILFVGAPYYPTAEWRKVLTDTAVGILLITTVHGLVSRVQLHAQAEAARAQRLAISEASARSILETATDAIVALSPDGRIVDVNPAALALFRGNRGDLIGRDLISTLAVAEEREVLRTGLAGLTKLGGEVAPQFNTRLLRVDGEPFPAEVTVGVVELNGTYRIHAFARDTTERAAVAAAAQRYLEDLQALLIVGQKLVTAPTGRTTRSMICSTALDMAGAVQVLLFEIDHDDLRVVASAGRATAITRIPRLGGSSMVATVAISGEAVFVGCLADDPRVNPTLSAQTGAKSGYWQPLQASAGVSGVLVVLWDQELDELDARTRSVLQVLASQAEVALQISELVDQLQDLARIDGLTGIPNRRTFDETLAVEVDRASRSGRPLSLVMLDLDHFKRFNDAHGHQAGDRFLVETAAAWKDELRPSDVIARYGGEEFVVILPDCPSEAALKVASRLRADVPSGQTVSAGVATWIAGESGAEIVGRADAALYRAKAAGRDRAVAA